MDKTKQIWSRYNTDQKQLKTDCVDLVSKCYLMLGQKPDTQQVVIMAQLLYDDLITSYSRLTMEEALDLVLNWLQEAQQDWRVLWQGDSPIEGGDGNREYLLHLVKA